MPVHIQVQTSGPFTFIIRKTTKEHALPEWLFQLTSTVIGKPTTTTLPQNGTPRKAPLVDIVEFIDWLAPQFPDEYVDNFIALFEWFCFSALPALSENKSNVTADDPLP